MPLDRAGRHVRLARGLRCSIAGEFLRCSVDPIEPLPGDAPPVRVVWCEHDRVLPFAAFGQPFLDRLGLKAHGILQGCGHNPVYDNPQGIARAVLEFTWQVETSAA